MKRFFLGLFTRRSKTKVYHINYSDPTIQRGKNTYYYMVGTIRDQFGHIVGQFDYIVTWFGAVLRTYDKDKRYYLAKSKYDDLSMVDAWIHPDFGGMENVHSLRNFLKLEFGI